MNIKQRLRSHIEGLMRIEEIQLANVLREAADHIESLEARIKQQDSVNADYVHIIKEHQGRIFAQEARIKELEAAQRILIEHNTAKTKLIAELEAGLLLALYHHQGGHSPVGQPIRRLLGIGQFDHMTEEQIAIAHVASSKPDSLATPGECKSERNV